MPGATLRVSGVQVAYRSGRREETTVEVSSLHVNPGSLIVLTGPSGSGKTTLLHVFAGILPPRSGSVTWNQTDIASLKEAARDAWRRDHVGLVFQDFHLIDSLSPIDNVLLPATFSHFVTPASIKRRAHALLETLQIPVERGSVADLSRGERQRVAMARALLFDPPILLADEPTASLDRASAEQVADELAKSAAQGRTTIVVSHDRLLIERAGRRLQLERGQVIDDVCA